MTRPFRVAASFCVVLLAYWTYALLAVPWIEPAAAPRSDGAVTEAMLAEAREAAANDPRQRLLAPLFAPTDWEISDRAKILETEQVQVLVLDWDKFEGNEVHLEPCTLIFTAKHGTPEERIRQAVVLQAPHGARLTFDRALDLRRGDVGRLIAGKLVGEVTIRSLGKSPGPEDDLKVTTRELELTDDGLWTPHDVEFHWGASSGRGAHLQAKFVPGQRGTANSHGLNVGGVETIELKHLEQLHLEFGHGGIPLGKPAKPKPAAAEPIAAEKTDRPEKAAADANWPIEVACRGPFRYDFGQQLATFEDRVDVRRINPEGPSDQITCELLAIYFTRKTPQAEAKSNDNPANLQPKRLEAQGRPVTIHAQSQDAHAQGEYLEYDLLGNRMVLRPLGETVSAEGATLPDPSREVYVRQGPSEIHAPALEYQLGQGGKLGQAVAAGPGWLRAETKDHPGKPLTARWNQELRMRPQDGEQVVSLLGGAELSYDAIGKLTAGEIHFWMKQAVVKDRSQAQPDRMLAKNAVRVESSQLNGAVEQLEVWFEQTEVAGQVVPVLPGAPAQPAAPAAPQAQLQRGPSLETMWTAVEVQRQAAPLMQIVRRPVPDAPRPQHFDVQGRLLRARVISVGKSSDVGELMIEGKVRFTETQTARPEEKPLVLTGDRVHVLDASQPYAAATITGSPAHFEGRGIGLTGSNINLNRGTNRLWIEGPGRLDLAVDRDLDGRAIPEGMPLAVRWQGGMEMDDRTVRFEDSVLAQGRDQNLQTDTLEIVFCQPVRFASPQGQPQPKMERVRCRGGVLVEGRTADAQGPASFERIEARDLSVHLITGEINAAGPGRLASVRRSSAAAMAQVGLPTQAIPPPAAGDPKLGYLEVRFQRDIAGNMQTRQMTFNEQVTTVYGPVPSWDASLSPDRPELLGPQGAVMQCDRLTVTQMPGANPNERTLELEAVGNTRVEGEQFTARGHRITYAQAKDLLILEGDGRSDAQLFRQTGVGRAVTPMSARRILYWPSTRKGYIDGFRSLEHQMTGAAGKP